MAGAPSYAATPRVSSAAVPAAADASYTAPVNIATVITAGAAGTKIDEIVFAGIGSTVQGAINVFVYDGAAYHLHDSIQVPVWAASATIPPWRLAKSYAHLVLPPGSSLRVSSMVANQLVNVEALGGDF